MVLVQSRDILMFSIKHMRGSRKFCQRGSKFDDVFFLILSCLGNRGSKFWYK